jgi:hypothetical protein
MRAAVKDLETIVAAARRRVAAEQFADAEVLYRSILRDTTPPTTGRARVARGEACTFFARKALSHGRLGEAGDWFRDGIDADPLAADYRCDLAIKVLLPLGMVDAAVHEARVATKIELDSVRAWRVLGSALHEKGDAEGSRGARQRAVELAPSDPRALLDLAVIELDTANYDRVRELCCAVAAEHPNRAGDVLHCLGMVAYREGKHELAIKAYTDAIEAGCSDTEMARWNRALPLHSIGRYREGWMDYEARGKQNTSPLFSTAMRRFAAPLWQGFQEHPVPARLHLHEEMGYGDTIAMARYAPLLAEQGYDVRIEVRESLVELFRHSMPAAVTVVAKAVDYPGALGISPFDYHAPLLSLPCAMGTDIDTVPWRGPYLLANPSICERWLRALPKGRRVGLCWSSGIRNGIWLSEYGRRKSMRFVDLAPLFSVEANFVSLQCGPPAAENEILPGIGAVEPTWAETAALIDCLDLVITVDSAVAHLAGAMGKPVWLMMHTEGSWHWMTGCDNSPWYPSVTIYRQQTPHEWNSVVQRIAEDLSSSS